MVTEHPHPHPHPLQTNIIPLNSFGSAQLKKCAPNFHTYNTAFSACLDNSAEGTRRAAALAKMMIEDVDAQLLACDIDNNEEFVKDLISLLPDTYTKKVSERSEPATLCTSFD